MVGFIIGFPTFPSIVWGRIRVQIHPSFLPFLRLPAAIAIFIALGVALALHPGMVTMPLETGRHNTAFDPGKEKTKNVSLVLKPVKM